MVQWDFETYESYLNCYRQKPLKAKIQQKGNQHQQQQKHHIGTTSAHHATTYVI